MITPEIRRRVRGSESTRNSPYMDCCGKSRFACSCPKPGHLTIGVGHNLDAKPLHSRVIDLQFEIDLDDAAADLQRHLPWTSALDAARYEVMLDLSFNMGIHTLIDKNPRFLHAMEQGDYRIAAFELLDGPYKTKVGERAYHNARQIETGDVQV